MVITDQTPALSYDNQGFSGDGLLEQTPVVEDDVIVPENVSDVQGACIGKLPSHKGSYDVTTPRSADTYLSFDNLSRPPSIYYRDSQIDDLDDDIPDFVPVEDKLVDPTIDDRSSGIPSSLGTDIISPMAQKSLPGDHDSGIKDEHDGMGDETTKPEEQPDLIESVKMTADLDLDNVSFGDNVDMRETQESSDPINQNTREDLMGDHPFPEDYNRSDRPKLRDFDAEIPDILMSSGDGASDEHKVPESGHDDHFYPEEKFAGEGCVQSSSPADDHIKTIGNQESEDSGAPSIQAANQPDSEPAVGETDDYEADESMLSTTSQDEESGHIERPKLRDLDAELGNLVSLGLEGRQSEMLSLSGNEADEEELHEDEKSPGNDETHAIGSMPSHMRDSALQRSTSEANAYSADDEDSVFDIADPAKLTLEQRNSQSMDESHQDCYNDDFERFCREESIAEKERRARFSEDSSQVSFWLQGGKVAADEKQSDAPMDVTAHADEANMSTSDPLLKLESYTPDALTPEQEDLADQARDVDKLEKFAKSLVEDAVATATSSAEARDQDETTTDEKPSFPEPDSREMSEGEMEDDDSNASPKTSFTNKTQNIGTSSPRTDEKQCMSGDFCDIQTLCIETLKQEETEMNETQFSSPKPEAEQSSPESMLEKDESHQSLGTDSDVTEKQGGSSSASRAMTDSGTSYDFSSAEDLKEGAAIQRQESNEKDVDGSGVLHGVTSDSTSHENRPPFDKDHSRPSFGGLSMISSEGERRLSFSDIESESEADVTLTDDQIQTIDNPEMQESLASSTDASLVGGTYVLESGAFTELRGLSLQPTLSNDSSVPARSTSISDEVFTDNSHERSCSPSDVPLVPGGGNTMDDSAPSDVFVGSDTADERVPSHSIDANQSDSGEPTMLTENDTSATPPSDHSPSSSTGSIEPISVPADMDPLASIIDFGQGHMTQSRSDPGNEKQDDRLTSPTATSGELDESSSQAQHRAETGSSGLSIADIDLSRQAPSDDDNRRSSIVRFSNDVNVTIQDDNGVVLSENIVEPLHDEEIGTPDGNLLTDEHERENLEEDNQGYLPESASFEESTDFTSGQALSDEESDALAASIVAQAIQDSVKLYRQELSPPPDVSQSGSNNSIYDNLTTEESPEIEGMEFIVNDDEDEFSLFQNRQLSAVEELSESEGSIGSGLDVKTGFVDSVLEQISPADSVEDNAAKDDDIKPAAQSTDITESFEDNSQEDDLDISSVDSVNTVVHPDGSEVPEEDRLNEIASMTSSITSDVPIGPDLGLAPLIGIQSYDSSKPEPSTPPARSEVSTPNSDIGVIQKFPRLHEPDTVSVSSSLAEFEHLEKSVTKDSPRSSMYMEKVLERSDRESVSSSVLEFESMESEVVADQPDVLPSPMHVPNEKTNSTNSLCEFETLEEDVESEEMKREAEKVIAEISAVMSGSTSDEIKIGPEDSLLVNLEGMDEINQGHFDVAHRSDTIKLTSPVREFSPSYVGDEQTYSESHVAETTGVSLSEELAFCETVDERRDSVVSTSHESVEGGAMDEGDDTSTAADAIQSIIDEAAANFEQMRSEMSDSVILGNLDSQLACGDSPIRPEKSKCIVMAEPPLPADDSEPTITLSTSTDLLSESHSPNVMTKSVDSLTEDKTDLRPQMTDSTDSLKDEPETVMKTSTDSLRDDAGDIMEASTDSLQTDKQPFGVMTKSADSIGGDQPNVMVKSLDSLSSEVIHQPYLQESPVNAMSDSVYQEMVSSSGSSPPEGVMMCSTDSLGKGLTSEEPAALIQSTDSLGTPVQTDPAAMSKSTDSLGTPTASNPVVMSTSTDSLDLRQDAQPIVKDHTTAVDPLHSSTDSLEQAGDAHHIPSSSASAAEDSMSVSFHQNYPTALNPFAARGDPDSDNESRSTTSSRSSRSSRSTRTREPYESDYRYEPRQKVFTMADVEAEREAKKVRKDSRSQSPTSSLGSQSGEGTC